MSSRKNNPDMILSNSSITKISQALHVIQEYTEWKTKSITFQSNGGVLNVGGGSTIKYVFSICITNRTE